MLVEVGVLGLIQGGVLAAHVVCAHVPSASGMLTGMKAVQGFPVVRCAVPRKSSIHVRLGCTLRGVYCVLDL